METLAAEDRDAAMAQMLRQLPLLLGEDAGFAAYLAKMPFVPVGSGGLKAPQDLFDPRYNLQKHHQFPMICGFSGLH